MLDWEYGYLIVELNLGRYFKKDLVFLKVIIVGVNKEMIIIMGGLSIKLDIFFDECIFESKDFLILLGGIIWSEEIY